MEEAEAQERKERFVALLKSLLNQCEGIKGKLAQKLDIKPSTLTPWLQGKIDPASLETLVFSRIAEVAGHTTDSLAKLLKILEIEKEQKISQEQLKSLIEQMLFTQSREQLGLRLGISQKTISNWLNPERDIAPGKIPIGTLAKLAVERGWTIERLLAYLNLKKKEEVEEDVLALIQSQTKQLSFPSQVKLLSWLSGDFEKKLSSLNAPIVNTQDEKILSDQKVLIILENDHLSLASLYSSNLVFHLHLQPENIKIATPSSMPESLEDFDVLIFDINSQQSPCISLVESLQFEGDIVIFADSSLPDDVRERLKQKATEIIVKPVPWRELKDLPYFS